MIDTPGSVYANVFNMLEFVKDVMVIMVLLFKY